MFVVAQETRDYCGGNVRAGEVLNETRDYCVERVFNWLNCLPETYDYCGET